MQVSEVEMKASSARVAQALGIQGAAAPAKAMAATSKTAAAGTSSGTSSGTTNDITSNDFLTLLVTEMQNQDPTQPTDPNAYIQQLVGVNSLQQLISINQELGTAVGETTSSSSVSPTSSVDAATGAATSKGNNY